MCVALGIQHAMVMNYIVTCGLSSSVLYCGRVPAANAPGRTAAEGLLYEPWSLVVPTCTDRCLHQRVVNGGTTGARNGR